MDKLFKGIMVVLAAVVIFFIVQTFMVENGIKIHLSANVDYKEKIVTVQYVDHNTSICDF